MSNVIDFHSPTRVEGTYDDAIAHLRECIRLIEGMSDAQFYPLFDLSHQRTTSGNCSLVHVVFHDLLSGERNGRGGRGE
jgi:hypothetical protein